MSQLHLTRREAAQQPTRLIYVWQFPVRLFHWTTAACVTVLFLTGLYMAHPILSTPGEPWHNFLMARVRQIHFIAAYIWVIVYGLRSYWFIVGNKFARSGLPAVWNGAWWRQLGDELGAYFLLRRSPQPRIGHNALAGLSYTIVPIGIGACQILTGMALYSESYPEGFWAHATGWVLPLMGGSFRVHMWHHMFAWTFLWFVMLHVYIVVFDSLRDRNSLVESMITGYKTKPTAQSDEHD